MAGDDDTQLPGEQTAPPSPSATGEQTTAPASPSATPEATTEPTGDTRTDLLSAVQQAVPELRSSDTDEQPAAGQGASPAPTAPSDQAATDEDPELPDDITQEEYAKYSQSAKRRLSKLVKQRRELRAEVEHYKTTVEPQAKAAEQVTSYLRENDIGRDDFLLTLELAGAMRRGDFRTFYEGIQPYVKLAEEYLGISLPADLQQRVREGHMTTQAAQQFSRERMDRLLSDNRHARVQQQHETQQQLHQRETLANSVRDTVNAWETQVMRTDPDYAAKRAAVQDTMWAVVREHGAPQTPDHAVAIANESLRRVNERYRAWTPQRRPTSRTPSSTGRSNGAAPEAKSLKEAVQIARERARL